MKKKRNVLFLTTLVSLTTLSIGTLASCQTSKPSIPQKEISTYSVSILNDNKLGTALLYDDKGAVTTKINSDTYGVLKVSLVNTDYEVESVKSGTREFSYSEEKEGYLIDNLTSDTTLTISYKKVFANLKVSLDVPDVKSYKVFANDVELTKDNSYIVGIGNTVGISFELKENRVFEKLKVNETEIEFNKNTNRYEFIMPSSNAEVTIETYKTAKVNFLFSENLNPTFKLNDKIITIPEILKVGTKLVIEALLPDGYAYDSERSSIADETSGIILTETQAKVEVIENKIIATIFEVEDFEYSISILTRKIGKYDGEDFIGSWSSPKGTDIANFNPTVSFSGNEKCALSFVNGSVTASGTYSKNTDGTIVAKFKNGNKNIRGIFRTLEMDGEVIAIYGEVYDGYGDKLLLFKDGKVTTQFKVYNFSNDNTKSIIRFENTVTNKVKWMYSTQYTLLDTSVESEDGQIADNLEDNLIYRVSIRGKKTEIKFSKNHLTIAGIEQGTYTKEASPNLIVDGYGKATIGADEYTYEFNESSSVIILTKDSTQTKLEISLYDLTYKDYVPKTNMLTGFSYHFRADDHDENNRSYQDVDFRFKDSNYIIVNAGVQCKDGETSYTLTDDRKFSAVLPFLCGDKLVKGVFNETFTEIKFTTSKLIYEGDMIGVVGKLTTIEGDFKSKDTSSSDVLHLKANSTYSLNDEASSEYFLDISLKGVVLKGSQNYKLNLETRTFESSAKKPGNWFIWNTFVGNMKNDDGEPVRLLSATIVFDSSTNDTIKSLKIIQRTIGWNQGDDIYEVTNAKYSYDSSSKTITITDGNNIVQLLNDEKHNQLIFKGTPELNGVTYYYSSMRVTAQ